MAKLRLVLPITIFFIGFYALGQEGYWKPKSKLDRPSDPLFESVDMAKAKVFKFDENALVGQLDVKGGLKTRAMVVHFPDEQGELVAFKVRETPVLSKKLAAKYPGIKSYTGYGLKNKTQRIKFSVSHRGVQGTMALGDGKGHVVLQKAHGEGSEYLVYNRNNRSGKTTNFVCETKTGWVEKSADAAAARLVDERVLRKFRIAVSATGEYTNHHGGTVADALAAINATITRINEVFERDLGVTLELVDNNDQVVYTNAATDPYTGSLNSQLQITLDNEIGAANYDIGHLFHKNDLSGGDAGFIGAVCRDGEKGSGYSAGASPEGDLFDIDFVAHELGHQFGANHTFSHEFEGTDVQAEPASGTTIMSYAGVTDGENVQATADDYFHYNSIFQITEYIKTTSCAEEIPLANNTPSVVPVQDYIIPVSTAFVLEGSATDADSGDILTYTWEQVDSGFVPRAVFGPDNAAGANFRSLPPSTDPMRYFPKLSRIVSGTLTETNPDEGGDWETLSGMQRDLNFAFTVRDNATGGGQVVSDLAKVSVIDDAGPFVVTSQLGGETYAAGSVQEVTWDVANTNVPPINLEHVDIMLSTDGGLGFPIMLAEATPNDGSHEVLIPGTATNNARIMVRANGNVFLAVNSNDFVIESSPMVLGFDKLAYAVCQGDDLSVSFDYETYEGFSEEAVFSVSGLPAGLTAVITPGAATENETDVAVVFSDTENVTPGTYAITIEAVATGAQKKVALEVSILENSFPEVVLMTPANETIDIPVGTMLSWEMNPVYESYDVEIATDEAFTNVVESATVIFDSYQAVSLDDSTTYFWRVKPNNACGEGNFGTPFSFTTIVVNCKTRSGDGLPVAISAIGTPTVTSKLTFIDDLPIADINVNLSIDHTWISDMIITLISPSGTRVLLASNSCGDETEDIDAIFDDEAPSGDFVCGNEPAIGGKVKPIGSLAAFDGESLFGEWTLEVQDIGNQDGGAITSFSMEVCVEGVFRPDDDNDGVFDDIDACLGTPEGAEVNADGCQVFRFSQDNFAVSVQSESCRNNNDGSLQLDAEDTSLTYTATLTGNGVDDTITFADAHTFQNLTAGNYTVCIDGTDGTNTYEQLCYTVVLGEPVPLAVSAVVNTQGTQASLSLQGADSYIIEFNDETIRTSDSQITLDLKTGINSLKVHTDLPCQGNFEKELLASGEVLLYPNPLISELKLFPGIGEGEVTVAIYDAAGQLVRSEKHLSDFSEIELDFSTQPSGLYFIKLNGKNKMQTFRVIKR